MRSANSICRNSAFTYGLSFQSTSSRFIDCSNHLLQIIINYLQMTNSLLNEFQIPKDFAKVPLVLIGMHLHLWYQGLQVSRVRKQLFNKEFMKKHFGQVHKNELGEQIQPAGYPDVGSGLYSQKLSYKDWYRFNISQRIHLNYVEGIGLASTAVVSAGLVNPNYGVGVGLAYILGRFLYSLFYKKKNGAANPGRILGVALCYLANLTGIGLFLWKFINHGFN